MADSFAGVSVTFDKTSYNTGDTITMTLVGEDVLTTTQSVALSGTINLVAADGATTTINFPAGSTVTTTVATNESTKISSVADTENPARVWTPAANGLTATATA